MGPEALAHVLRPLQAMFPAADHPALLVGLDGADDAAVYRLADDLAIVVTTDFFPPVVDDPYAYGAIAAANAMSDVFAMGGEVLLALNLVAFPDDLAPDEAAAILRGGAERVRAVGAVVAGGHSIVDREPKYGLAVVGRADPARLLRKAGARPGDALVLTKPLGTGLVTTALKRAEARADDVAAAVASMAALNRAAGHAAAAAGAHAATDITGFGLVGHAVEVADASGVRLRLRRDALPLLSGALAYAAAGCAPGGTARNASSFGSRVIGDVDDVWRSVLFDPQTSGGLLIAVPPGAVDTLRGALAAAAPPAAPPGSEAAALDRGRTAAVDAVTVVGEVVEGDGIEVVA